MLVAASTVKDSLAHARRFVTGNLGGGLDHLVVFLDAPGDEGQREVRDYLESHQHVTCVRAGRAWWGERPRALNERQCTNATVVKAALAAAPGADDTWVFHVDGDEVVRVDRDLLARLPGDVAAVRLAPREAVSRLRWDGEPTLFKRLLGDADLARLHRAGAIAEPTNQALFNGHLQGKTGVRATTAGTLGLHRALAPDGSAVASYDDEALELFHYESYSGEDFVRKWTAMASSGPLASYRPGRARHARDLRELLGSGLPPGELHDRLVEAYRATTEDDVDALWAAGVLLETDPLAGTHQPQPDPAAVDGLRARLEELRGADKSGYFNGSSASDARRVGPPRLV